MADGHDNPNALWRGSQIFLPIALRAMRQLDTLRADLERQERGYRSGSENRQVRSNLSGTPHARTLRDVIEERGRP